jgi:hypothetical protein
MRREIVRTYCETEFLIAVRVYSCFLNLGFPTACKKSGDRGVDQKLGYWVRTQHGKWMSVCIFAVLCWYRPRDMQISYQGSPTRCLQIRLGIRKIGCFVPYWNVAP